jgi:hypothetical protein
LPSASLPSYRQRRGFFDPLTPPEPISLLPYDADNFALSDDSSQAGTSSGTISAHTDPDDDDAPFIRFQGHTVTTLPSVQQTSSDGNVVVRTGFVSFTCVPTPPPSLHVAFLNKFNYSKIVNLKEHNTLELTLRLLSPRSFTLNFHADSYIPHEVYQGYLLHDNLYKDHHPWVTITLPFHKLLLTSHGQVKESQRELDNAELERFGLMIGDNVQGDFCVDIKSVNATWEEMDWD